MGLAAARELVDVEKVAVARRHLAQRLDDRRRRDAVLGVVGFLDRPTTVGLADGGLDRVGHAIGVEDHAALGVSRRAADRQHEVGGRSQEAFFVGVEDADEGDLGKVEPFAQEVDADEHVVFAAPQGREDLDALEGVDV